MASGAGARQAALLRGINVGGANLVAMARLRETYQGIGASDVVTLLQSGNVVFRHAKEPAAVARLAEAAIGAELGLKIAVIGRTHAEMAEIVSFQAWADANPSQRFVVFLDGEPDPAGLEALRAVATDREELLLAGRELHMHLRDGIGRSRLTLTLIEKRLGVKGSARNWNTVTKLAAMTAD